MFEIYNDEERHITPAKQRRIRQLMLERILFIKCEGFVRICRSHRPKWFLKDLQSHSPFELTIVKEISGGAKVVREIEELFASYRHHGQWFIYKDSLKSWIENLE